MSIHWMLSTFRVSELDKCPRQIELKFKGAKELSPHFIQISGKIVHATTKDILEGREPKLDFSEFPEAKIELELEVAKPMDNLQAWLKNPILIKTLGRGAKKQEVKEILDLGGALIEKEMFIDVGDGFIFQGRADLITSDKVIDFKTGLKRNTKEHRRQLVAYSIMGKQNGIITNSNPRLFNVFLGGEAPMAFELDAEEKIDAEADMWEAVEKHKGILTLVGKGVRMPCKISFDCVYCPYIGIICRGV